LRENKFKVQTSTGKVMASIFCNKGNVVVEFLKRGATINSEQYVQTLEKLKQKI
jgi:hypothetical protein